MVKEEIEELSYVLLEPKVKYEKTKTA